MSIKSFLPSLFLFFFKVRIYFHFVLNDFESELAIAVNLWFVLTGILKGQSHEKVGEMSVWGISLGPN
jgi:hypothetical protein